MFTCCKNTNAILNSNEGQLRHSSFNILWGECENTTLKIYEIKESIIKVLHRLMTAEIRFWDQPPAFVRNTTLS